MYEAFSCVEETTGPDNCTKDIICPEGCLHQSLILTFPQFPTLACCLWSSSRQLSARQDIYLLCIQALFHSLTLSEKLRVINPKWGLAQMQSGVSVSSWAAVQKDIIALAELNVGGWCSSLECKSRGCGQNRSGIYLFVSRNPVTVSRRSN